jgi:hypothetical protein
MASEKKSSGVMLACEARMMSEGEAPVRGTAGIWGSAERAGQETNGRSIERSNTMAGGNLAVIESEREAVSVAVSWAGPAIRGNSLQMIGRRGRNGQS